MTYYLDTILVVATGNPGKLREMQTYLADFPWQLELKPDGLDVEETGTTFTENACLKASEVAKATGQWSIADDSGLRVDALDGMPGVYSARYADTDAARIQRLLEELEGQPNRQAQFVCVIALARPDGTIALASEGICHGEIATQPQGAGGFGYDPIFYVPEQGMTFAQMPPALKHSISHRGLAFATFRSQLAQLKELNS